MKRSWSSLAAACGLMSGVEEDGLRDEKGARLQMLVVFRLKWGTIRQEADGVFSAGE